MYQILHYQKNHNPQNIYFQSFHKFPLVNKELNEQVKKKEEDEINYKNIIEELKQKIILLNKIEEQGKIIDTQKKEIEKLTEDNNYITNENEKLKKELNDLKNKNLEFERSEGELNNKIKEDNLSNSQQRNSVNSNNQK